MAVEFLDQIGDSIVGEKLDDQIELFDEDDDLPF